MAIELPDGCPRGRTDCEALSRIESDCGESFVCAGINDGTNREHYRDKFRLCFVNDITDTMHDMDDADMADTASVIVQAISVNTHLEALGVDV